MNEESLRAYAAHLGAVNSEPESEHPTALLKKVSRPRIPLKKNYLSKSLPVTEMSRIGHLSAEDESVVSARIQMLRRHADNLSFPAPEKIFQPQRLSRTRTVADGSFSTVDTNDFRASRNPQFLATPGNFTLWESVVPAPLSMEICTTRSTKDYRLSADRIELG